MDVDVDCLTISDVTIGDRWNETQLEHVFGTNFNVQELTSSSIDPNSCNHWIWNPHTRHHKISAFVYKHLNQNLTQSESWPGWQLLWKLNIAPRTKHFLWTVFHGRLSTSNFLFQLRLGPNNTCALCGLFPETIDHLFCQCIIAKHVWNYLSLKINTYIHFPIGFAVGSWLTDGNLSKHCASIIAATAWLIWKSHCDVIFRNAIINIPAIACRALSHVQEYTASNRCLAGHKLILNNFSCANELFLFSHSSPNPGCCAIAMIDSLMDELSALDVALHSVLDNRLNIKHIFVNTTTTLSILNHPNPVTTWRFNSQIANIRSLLEELGSSIHCTPKTWMLPAVNLATHGVNSSDINLFLFGRELPH
ncbi:uncharacterized protein LOC120271661 [Dioscorea cayenensis subsp. rotundata]|uniref:Uncharacterized protein LOC120271661 n=1 Tax=Dioscorea cayennensis subsp. rotundata TaxID=55577 RepID=A0AB40C3B9_DIOCR|nr:uncharacterized protein LOC120271661 [Dioscorea cayenensis subsp. rotundata]